MASLWSTLADANFDEETKISKLKTVIPPDVYNYIALEARKCKRYDEMVQLVETQTMDPITGVAKGEQTPGLSHISQEEKVEESWERDGVERYLYSVGVDCSTEEG